MKKHIQNGFIEPFKNKAMIPMYLGSLFALIGMTIPQLYLAFDYASAGMEQIIEHMVWRLVIGSVVFMAAWLIMLSKFGPKPFLIIVATAQLVSLIALSIVGIEGTIIIVTLLFVTLATGFWAMFHGAMSIAVSNHNSGNEISLAGVMMSIGVIIGSTVGGLTLHYQRGDIALFLGGVLMFLGTLCIGLYMLKHAGKTIANVSLYGENEGIESYLTPYRRQKMFFSAFEGFNQSVIDFLSPIWLMLLSLNGLAIGFITAVSAFLKLVLSPLFGHLANMGRDGTHNKDLQYGLSLKALGWLPWLFIKNPLIFLISNIFWGAGSHLYAVGLSSRWYKDRSVLGLIIREVCLGVGRLVAILIFIPLMYWDIDVFFKLVIAISLAMSLYAFLKPLKPVGD